MSERSLKIGVSEPWAKVGGPEPYHDSYTFSLFTRAENESRLLDALASAAAERGAAVEEVIRAAADWRTKRKRGSQVPEHQ